MKAIGPYHFHNASTSMSLKKQNQPAKGTSPVKGKSAREGENPVKGKVNPRKRQTVQKKSAREAEKPS